MTRPLLSAALIVRDEAHHLEDCLASLHGLADEIVVVDTGSVDDSVAIARAHGAVVLEHPWTGNFSAVRNAGLERAQGEWILYLDADERVRPIERARLCDRLRDAPETALRVLLRPFVHATPYFEYRLWRSDPRVRFRGVMHERVLDAIQTVAAEDGRRIAEWPELELDHIGYEGDQTVKHRRNLPLLEAQLELEPTNVYNWRHLAQVLAGLGRAAEAETALLRAVAIAREQDPPTAEGSLAWGDLVRLRHERGDDVSELLEEGRRRWPEQWLLVWIDGHVHLDAGRLDIAESRLRRLLSVDRADLAATGLAYDERIFSVFSLESLGLVLFRQGRYAEAAATYAEAERLDEEHLGYRAKRMLAEARAAGMR